MALFGFDALAIFQLEIQDLLLYSSLQADCGSVVYRDSTISSGV